VARQVGGAGGQAGGPEGLPDLHEPLGLGEGQAAQQHRVHQGEDHRGRADAERHGGDRDRGEARLPQQQAGRVAHLPDERPHAGHLRSRL
jgi:hypothetical protein